MRWEWREYGVKKFRVRKFQHKAKALKYRPAIPPHADFVRWDLVEYLPNPESIYADLPEQRRSRAA